MFCLIFIIILISMFGFAAVGEAVLIAIGACFAFVLAIGLILSIAESFK